MALVDLLLQRNFENLPGLNNFKLALLILDFYETFIKIDLPFFFHTSQVVLVKTDPDSEIKSQSAFNLKLLPFIPALDFNKIYSNMKPKPTRS